MSVIQPKWTVHVNSEINFLSKPSQNKEFGKQSFKNITFTKTSKKFKIEYPWLKLHFPADNKHNPIMNRYDPKFKWCYLRFVCPCEVRTTIRVSVTMQKRLPLRLISLPYMTYSFKPLIKPCWLVFYSLGWMQKLIKIPSQDGPQCHIT